MSQKNTLFNYFTSPTPRKISDVNSPTPKTPTQDSTTPKTPTHSSTTPKTGLKAEKNVNKTPRSTKTGTKRPNIKANTPASRKKLKINKDINLHDVVWAKLDGYPWWPSIICKHPTKHTYQRGKEYHVQFFDNPPTRAWISKRHVELYNNASDKKEPHEDLDKWKHAIQEADKAVKTAIEERESIIFKFPVDDLSDDEDFEEEEDDDEEESMNISPASTDGDKENKRNATNEPPVKRRRILDLDDDSEDDYKPEEQNDEESDSASSGVDSAEELVESEPEEPESPEKKKRKPNNSKKTTDIKIIGTPSAATKSLLSSFSANQTSTQKSCDEYSWNHLKYDFLQPTKVRDAMRHPPDHPNYNPRTLHVPEDFKRNLTPAMKQWWDIKSKHFDCVLFFKVGKFYELYHMDAVTGVSELGLSYMKGDFAHSGFPEIAYGRFAASLIEKGYKVARVEQTETPEMMADRCKGLSKPTKFDKVVKREICQITSQGTRIFSVLDGDVREAEANYLLALTEQSAGARSSYGVCFIDTSIGEFHLGQFFDDRYSSRLRTLLAHHPPVQILYERGSLSEKTFQLLNSVAASVKKEVLAPETEFWSSQKTLLHLAEGEYFKSCDGGSRHVWPEALKSCLSEADALGLTPRDNCELSIKALGACIWYLKESLIEQQILAMGKFSVYTPVDSEHLDKTTLSKQNNPMLGKHMVLDGITLKNLDVLGTAIGEKGSLLQKLDFCCTPFGKRLLRQWICSPLCDIAAITARQEAVQELLKCENFVKDIRSMLAQLPDLERMISKIHALGNSLKSKSHPDSRAVFYEDKVYSKKKILDFIAALNGFKLTQKIAQAFEESEESISSKLLIQYTHMNKKNPIGRFPDIQKMLEFFDNAFDHEEAKKEGRIIPMEGVDPEYDAVIEELANVQKEISNYLESQKKYFGCKVSYFGTDKKRFQLEVPESAARKAGSDYELQSQRKGYKRFWTAKTKELLARLTAAEDQKKSVLKDLSRRIFAQFGEKYEEWNTVVQCLSVVDVLISLAEYARSEDGDICVPEFSTTDQPFIKIEDGRHPCISSTEGFIPNNTVIGCDSEASLILVTGPNMGGKSTLMRQLGLLVIMAHMGCHIPAVSCQLSPVDRIFTRLGASDDIMAGESTFFVELSETSAIFHHATKHSIVLVDELGRGTSTYDGTAIASAVVNELSEIGCRTLFSTHYHTLVEDFKNSPNISLGHMACAVENENLEDPSQETVTFLYKFAPGACPKSYGFNAAKLGGIPAHIISKAYQTSVELEREGIRRKLFQRICSVQEDNTLMSVMKLIKSL